MQNSHTKNIIDYLENNGAIKFAYLFGSCARNATGPLSDIDLAVYLDKRFDYFLARLRFMGDLDRLLKGHPFDFVILNEASLVLQYEVIRLNSILKENKNRRIPFETRVIREYLDTEPLREVHRQKLKDSFSKEYELGQ